MALETGSALGHYEILGSLGAGGMGEVYRARDPSLEREVAIKVLPEAFAESEERLARFEREAKSLAALNHPNIATVHGFESDGETRFLVMELVEGEDLAERIARGPIPVDEADSAVHPDCRGARGGARARDRPSGSEAGEHQGGLRRAREDPGLRPGESDGVGVTRFTARSDVSRPP